MRISVTTPTYGRPDWHRLLYRCYAAQTWEDKEQRHDEHLEQLEILLSRHPESRRYQQARAEVLLEMGDLDGCQLALQAAMSGGGGNDPDLLLVLANLQAARGDMEMGKETFERARALKDAAQERDKK